MKNIFNRRVAKHSNKVKRKRSSFIHTPPPLASRIILAFTALSLFSVGLFVVSPASVAEDAPVSATDSSQSLIVNYSSPAALDIASPSASAKAAAGTATASSQEETLRDSFGATAMSPADKILAAKAYAQTLVTDPTEWTCLSELWTRESGWRTDANNVTSGAYGIPQALPGNKIAQMGTDWQINWKTQIDWGIWYIQHASYKTPCNAWAHETTFGWY